MADEWKKCGSRCEDCGAPLDLKFVWDDDQLTDHAFNVFLCEECGLVVYESVAEDPCVVLIRKQGEIVRRAPPNAFELEG